MNFLWWTSTRARISSNEIICENCTSLIGSVFFTECLWSRSHVKVKFSKSSKSQTPLSAAFSLLRWSSLLKSVVPSNGNVRYTSCSSPYRITRRNAWPNHGRPAPSPSSKQRPCCGSSHVADPRIECYSAWGARRSHVQRETDWYGLHCFVQTGRSQRLAQLQSCLQAARTTEILSDRRLVLPRGQRYGWPLGEGKERPCRKGSPRWIRGSWRKWSRGMPRAPWLAPGADKCRKSQAEATPALQNRSGAAQEPLQAQSKRTEERRIEVQNDTTRAATRKTRGSSGRHHNEADPELRVRQKGITDPLAFIRRKARWCRVIGVIAMIDLQYR